MPLVKLVWTLKYEQLEQILEKSASRNSEFEEWEFSLKINLQAIKSANKHQNSEQKKNKKIESCELWFRFKLRLSKWF